MEGGRTLRRSTVVRGYFPRSLGVGLAVAPGTDLNRRNLAPALETGMPAFDDAFAARADDAEGARRLVCASVGAETLGDAMRRCAQLGRLTVSDESLSLAVPRLDLTEEELDAVVAAAIELQQAFARAAVSTH